MTITSSERAGEAGRAEVFEILNQLEEHSPNWIQTIRLALNAHDLALRKIVALTPIKGHTLAAAQEIARAALSAKDGR